MMEHIIKLNATYLGLSSFMFSFAKSDLLVLHKSQTPTTVYPHRFVLVNIFFKIVVVILQSQSQNIDCFQRDINLCCNIYIRYLHDYLIKHNKMLLEHSPFSRMFYRSSTFSSSLSHQNSIYCT